MAETTKVDHFGGLGPSLVQKMYPLQPKTTLVFAFSEYIVPLVFTLFKPFLLREKGFHPRSL